MKKKSNSLLILILGVLVVSIFSFVVVNNLKDNNSNNSYQANINEQMSTKIKLFKTEENKVKINVTDDIIYFCIKTTKTKPSNKSICWKEVVNGEAISSIYLYKKYYIWIMDDNGMVLGPINVKALER